MENLIKDEEVEAIIEPPPTKPIVKLTLPSELPSDSGYNPAVEPEFWKPIFEENEMLSIRTKINQMIASPHRLAASISFAGFDATTLRLMTLL